MKIPNDLLQDITIFHKNEDGTYNKYNVVASVRNTAYLNRNRTGVSSVDSALIRVFDIYGFKNGNWKCSKGDVIVNQFVGIDVDKAPLTKMREMFGKDNVYEVSSVAIFDYKRAEIKEINHVKIGGR